jgi:hypothetical protein
MNVGLDVGAIPTISTKSAFAFVLQVCINTLKVSALLMGMNRFDRSINSFMENRSTLKTVTESMLEG